MKMELRFTPTRLESEAEGTLTVSGYVNKTEQPSEILGTSKRFIEKIAKGTFARALKKANRDIDFLAEHKKDKILASTRNNSLSLVEDDQGLFMSATITPTSYGKDSYELIKSGIFKNMSFGFRTIKDSWKRIESNLYERTIVELELFEVSVVKDPAYSQSTISARGIDLVEEVEIPDIEIEVREERELPLDVQEKRLKVDIEKKHQDIQRAESFLENDPNSTSFQGFVKRENEKLTALNDELRQIQNQMEETIMKNEQRELQGAVKGGALFAEQIAPIIGRLESTSDVVSKVRKLKLTDSNLVIPFEDSLGEASFVDEDNPIPLVDFDVKKLTRLQKKRVGIAQRFSNVFLQDANDLDEASKNLMFKRVGKKLEDEILTGDGVLGFKGISNDVLVTSVNVAIAPTKEALRALYLKVNSEYRPFAKWYMSEGYFEKLSELTDNDGYLVKSKTVDGKVIPTLWGHEIDVTSSMNAGDVIGQVPVIFASITDSYTVAFSDSPIDTKFQAIKSDAAQAKAGTVLFAVETYCDGAIHNYQAVAKAVVA